MVCVKAMAYDLHHFNINQPSSEPLCLGNRSSRKEAIVVKTKIVIGLR